MTRELYNSTDGPLAYDTEGRMLAGRDRIPLADLPGANVASTPIAEQIAAGRFVVIDTPDAEPDAASAQPDAPVEAKDEPSDTPTPAPKRSRGGRQTQED